MISNRIPLNSSMAGQRNSETCTLVGFESRTTQGLCSPNSRGPWREGGPLPAARTTAAHSCLHRLETGFQEVLPGWKRREKAWKSTGHEPCGPTMSPTLHRLIGFEFAERDPRTLVSPEGLEGQRLARYSSEAEPRAPPLALGYSRVASWSSDPALTPHSTARPVNVAGRQDHGDLKTPRKLAKLGSRHRSECQISLYCARSAPGTLAELAKT